MTNQRFGIRQWGILAALTVLTGGLYGQAIESVLLGEVTDASGAGVSGATITALNKDTGVKSTTTTSSNGEYRFNSVAVGRYDVSASASGFTTATVADVALELNHTATINISLQVGTVNTSVEVTAAAALLDTSTAQLQTTYTTSAAENMGAAAFSKTINGSGIWNLSLLGAGVTSSGGVGQGTGPSIAGQRPENNTFSIDGVDNDNHYVTGPQVTVPNDAVAEFTLLQNQFNPEFGGGSGGVFNVLLKSGTNSVHGSIYEYFQNRDLNALDQQQRIAGDTSQPRYDNNRLGATVGGPIVRNKLFYFGDYEYNPLGQAANPAGTVIAPTASGIAALGNIPGVSATNLGVFKQYVPEASTATGSIMVGGVSIPTGPLTFASPNYYNSYNAVIAIDYNVSDRDQLRGRYLYNSSKGIDAIADLPVFFEPSPDVNNSGSISEFHNFSPSLENELRVSYSRNNANTTAGDFKFPGLDAFPNLAFDDLNLQVGPDPNTPSGSIENLSTLQDNLSKTWGRHTIKVGYSAFDVILAGYFVQRARGDYDYATLEEYLYDDAPTGGNLSGVSGERSAGFANVPFGFLSQAGYANDDFKIRPNLTLNIGVRYEYVQIPVGSRYQAESAIASVPGVITFAEPKSGKDQFAPRLGFAWSPGKSGLWSVRGGFAQSYDNTYINLNQNSSPPYFATTLDCDGEPGVSTPGCPAAGFLASGGLHSTATAGGWADPADARAAVASYTFDETKRPYALTGTMGVQRLLGKDYTIEARYVYTKGVHLWNQTRLNILSKVTPTDFLPTFLSMPSASEIASLTTTLAQIEAKPSNDLAQYGFPNNIVGYHPWGNSRYSGLALQMNKRYSKNFMYIAAFTWSHAQDDTTATNFSTILSPRRAQDFQDLAAEWSDSALDRRLRFTLTPMYDFRPFQNGNWAMKNILGNWNVSMTYTYQSPEYATVQSGVDSNLNGDSAGDRAIVNPAGTANVGSDVTPITNANGDTVAYLAVNPNARYIVAGPGALSNGGRNSLPLDPTNNIDASLSKRFNITERMAAQIGVQAFNAFNHAQFVGGYLSDVSPFGTNAISRSFLVPSSSSFDQYQQFVPSNARGCQLVAKFTF
jgi:hypothetical protein